MFEHQILMLLFASAELQCDVANSVAASWSACGFGHLNVLLIVDGGSLGSKTSDENNAFHRWRAIKKTRNKLDCYSQSNRNLMPWWEHSPGVVLASHRSELAQESHSTQCQSHATFYDEVPIAEVSHR